MWHCNPRFTHFLPHGTSTVHDIGTASAATDRRQLFDNLEILRDALNARAVLHLGNAIAQYVGLISVQQAERLEVLLARTGLNGQDPITRSEASKRLAVSRQRIGQIELQLAAALDRAAPPASIWMPQVDSVIARGWPENYTVAGIEAITTFFHR